MFNSYVSLPEGNYYQLSMNIQPAINGLYGDQIQGEAPSYQLAYRPRLINPRVHQVKCASTKRYRLGPPPCTWYILV